MACAASLAPALTCTLTRCRGSKPDEVFFGSGDGTVNVQSALVTQLLPAWENATYFQVSGVSHLGLVGSHKLINWVLGIVLGKKSASA